MCEIFDPSTSRSAQVAYAAATKTKNYREHRNITVLDILKYHLATLKLKNTNGFKTGVSL